MSTYTTEATKERCMNAPGQRTKRTTGHEFGVAEESRPSYPRSSPRVHLGSGTICTIVLPRVKKKSQRFLQGNKNLLFVSGKKCAHRSATARLFTWGVAASSGSSCCPCTPGRRWRRRHHPVYHSPRAARRASPRRSRCSRLHLHPRARGCTATAASRTRSSALMEASATSCLEAQLAVAAITVAQHAARAQTPSCASLKGALFVQLTRVNLLDSLPGHAPRVTLYHTGACLRLNRPPRLQLRLAHHHRCLRHHRHPHRRDLRPRRQTCESSTRRRSSTLL
jgi:hypothetical protein